MHFYCSLYLTIQIIPLVTIVSFACSIGVGSLIRVSMVNSEVRYVIAI